MKNIISCAFMCLAVAMSAYSSTPDWALYGVEVGSHSNVGFRDGLAVFRDYKTGYGAINTAGEVVIEPQFVYFDDFDMGMSKVGVSYDAYGIMNTRGQWLLKPEYTSIKKDNEHRGVYVVSKSTGEQGLFYNGRLVLPTEFSSIDTYQFPFVECRKDKENFDLNVITGDRWDYVLDEGGIYVAMSSKEDYKYRYGYYTSDGKRIDVAQNRLSSKGLARFMDEESQLYGLINAQSGDTVVPAQYSEMLEIWINDIMWARNSGNVTLYDAEGKILSKVSNRPDIQLLLDKKCIRTIVHSNSATYNGLYDYKGNVILPEKYINMYMRNDIPGDWYYLVEATGKESLYNVTTKKFYDYGSYSDGMLLVRNDTDSEYYYINIHTGYIIDKDIKYAGEFSEGLACVQFEGRDFRDIIDKSGKVVFYGSKSCNPESFAQFSEGVIKAKDENNYEYGYIYNPLGHKGYVYNQKNATDGAIRRWNDLGNEEFKKGNYAEAKEYFYRIMMCNPQLDYAVSNYAACLHNMGYYEEAIEAYSMALDINPNSAFAKKWMAVAQERLAEQYAAEQEVYEEEQNERTSTFLDALGSFCSMLGQVSGASNNSYSSYNSFSSSYASAGSASSGNYQSQYDRWERRAKSNYETLTNLGYRASDSKGNKRGSTGQSLNTGNYVLQKKALREAQREMRNIRQKARRAGITIVQSKWETATVGY
ncbi:MAG: WG repeat-containing protein [Bacteroidaceae bacterium]|nr:WG repeat-containing protein [Bacteroidaceae bacterium]